MEVTAVIAIPSPLGYFAIFYIVNIFHQHANDLTL